MYISVDPYRGPQQIAILKPPLWKELVLPCLAFAILANRTLSLRALLLGTGGAFAAPALGGWPRFFVMLEWGLLAGLQHKSCLVCLQD